MGFSIEVIARDVPNARSLSLGGNNSWGRPVNLEILPDGALLVSDDHAGAIYRISYRA